jgi:hypothetical protein
MTNPPPTLVSFLPRVAPRASRPITSVSGVHTTRSATATTTHTAPRGSGPKIRNPKKISRKSKFPRIFSRYSNFVESSFLRLRILISRPFGKNSPILYMAEISRIRRIQPGYGAGRDSRWRPRISQKRQLRLSSCQDPSPLTS